MSRFARSLPWLAGLLFVWGCGGGAPEVTVTVTPSTAEVAAGDTLQFEARVEGSKDTRVRWGVIDPGGGTVDGDGLYTAPATPGLYTVMAESVASRGTRATAEVKVVPAAPKVEISPAEVQVEAGRQVEFSVRVGGVQHAVVNWSVEEGSAGGTVTELGVYTAPPEPGTYHVVAQSRSQPQLVGRAAVTVLPSTVNIFLAPRELTLVAGKTFQFDGVATGTANSAVSWRVEPAEGGDVTQEGLYTAPASPGTYSVIATSVDVPDRSATATVTVVPKTRQISGTVTYGGPRQGRIYVVVQGSNTTGTSLTGPGAFTVRGVTGEGKATVWAFMDTLGTGTYVRSASPLASVEVNLTGDAIANVALSLVNPPLLSPGSLSAPGVIAGDGAALLTVPRSLDANGNELATHYTVYWSELSNPGPLNAYGSVTVRAGTTPLVTGLDPQGSYYFSARAESGTLTGPVSPAIGPIAVGGTIAGDRSVSGQLAWSEPLPEGSTWVIAYRGPNDGRLVRVTASESPAQWTVPGLAAADYELYALHDRNEDGELGPVDPVSFDQARFAELEEGSQEGLELELPAGQVRPRVAISRRFSGTNEATLLDVFARSNTRLVVRATLLAGPGIASPVDLAQSFTAAGDLATVLNLGKLRPKAGDVWALEVTYANALKETFELPITGVFDEPPQLVAPGELASASPVLQWQLPASGPTVTLVQVLVADAQGRTIWSKLLPPSRSETLYAGPSLTPSATYTWAVRAFDLDGNSGMTLGSFTVQ